MSEVVAVAYRSWCILSWCIRSFSGVSLTDASSVNMDVSVLTAVGVILNLCLSRIDTVLARNRVRIFTRPMVMVVSIVCCLSSIILGQRVFAVSGLWYREALRITLRPYRLHMGNVGYGVLQV